MRGGACSGLHHACVCLAFKMGLSPFPLQTAEALADLAAASGDQLRRFLQQAGWPAEAAAALPDQDALVAAVRSARWACTRDLVCTCSGHML